MDEPRAMRVSELARRAGVASSAVRFYEAQGVLPSPPRGANGYRRYDDIDLCRLRIVVSLRALGIELAESGRLAELCASGQCDEMSDQLQPRLAQRRAEIAAARAELDHLDAELARLQARAAAGDATPTLCLDRGVEGEARKEECTCET